jgi:hypothetical protein
MASTQRPASSRPLLLTGDSPLGDVIAEFSADTGANADRELRAALGHIDAELGTMPVRNVRPRHLTALIDDLRRAGLSANREATVAEALHAVFTFAVDRRLIAVNPMGGTPPPAPAAPQSGPTPTFTMLALGARVAFWTTWLIVFGFLALLLVLILELG